MKYIIMCGGYPKWEKWHAEVCGEALVARTIRLLKDAGIDDINISSNRKGFKKYGVPILKHDNKFHDGDHSTDWVDAFYPTDEPTTYLMGDVFYSPEAIRIIRDFTVDDVMFFASGPYTFAPAYIKSWGEPFAFKVMDTAYFRRCIDITRTYKQQGKFVREPISWELWQVIRNTRLNYIENNYCSINDYTCDVDGPEDIPKLEAVLSTYGIAP